MLVCLHVSRTADELDLRGFPNLLNHYFIYCIHLVAPVTEMPYFFNYNLRLVRLHVVLQMNYNVGIWCSHRLTPHASNHCTHKSFSSLSPAWLYYEFFAGRALRAGWNVMYM